jgi:hypothetical protein
MSAAPGAAELRAMHAASVAAITPVVWADEKVITTELLAKLYGADSENIKKNHSRNVERFEEGKHYFKLSGKELDNLRVTLSPSQISAKARTLILWTERGAARHAKMLETNAAWDVFEALEDSYFRNRVQPAAPPVDDLKLSTVADREPLFIGAVRMMLKHRQPFDKIYRTMNCYAGSARFKEMTVGQVGEAEQFVERLLINQDTRQDWLRIGANQAELTGEGAQLELIGFWAPGAVIGKIED